MLHLLRDNSVVSGLVQYGPAMLASIIVWTLAKAIYNIYFHPLAKFPGPKLAAATVWWQIWLEVIRGGSLSLKLWELHAQYGMSAHDTRVT